MSTLLLGRDHQGSALLLSGRPGLQAPRYTAYGHIPGPSCLSGFTGQMPDAVSGGYLLGLGYRLYNPVLMRFQSPDSWSPFNAKALNAYAYCEGDPVNQIDPSGHVPTFRSAVKTVLTAFRKQGNKVVTQALFHAVDASHGTRIMAKDFSTLTRAEAKFAVMRLRKDLKLANAQAEDSRQAISSANKGQEGAKIIFNENPDHIHDVLLNKNRATQQSVDTLKVKLESLDQQRGSTRR